MKIKAILVLALSGFTIVSGLRCWKCDNARSEVECKQKGRTERCRGDGRKMSCQTEIRSHEGWGGSSLISTGCKETAACYNNRGQNKMIAWLKTQCNPDKRNSVCRCCCRGFRCNRKNLLCKQKPLSSQFTINIKPKADVPKPGSQIEIPIERRRSENEGGNSFIDVLLPKNHVLLKRLKLRNRPAATNGR